MKKKSKYNNNNDNNNNDNLRFLSSHVNGIHNLYVTIATIYNVYVSLRRIIRLSKEIFCL